MVIIVIRYVVSGEKKTVVMDEIRMTRLYGMYGVLILMREGVHVPRENKSVLPIMAARYYLRTSLILEIKDDHPHHIILKHIVPRYAVVMMKRRVMMRIMNHTVVY